MKLTDNEYIFIYNRVPRACIDIIIKNKNGLLLTKRDIKPFKNKLHLPGGMIRKNEHICDALKRIAGSELGILPIKYKIENYIGEHLHENNENDIDVHSIAINIKVFSWQVTDHNIFSGLLFYKCMPPRKHVNDLQLKRIETLIGE